jgi:hypothetical protein
LTAGTCASSLIFLRASCMGVKLSRR